jgi:phenylalanyl-tRNA synthetase alpha chain
MSDVDLIGALQSLEREALEAVARAGDERALEAVRVSYLGRSDGSISLVLRRLGTLPAEARPAVGQEANRVKAVVGDALESRSRMLRRPAETGSIDLTLPSRSPWKGGLHPVTQAVDEIWAIFRAMGFSRARGPEADTTWYNFEALNTPLDHPAADVQDTMYLVDFGTGAHDGEVPAAHPHHLAGVGLSA